MNNKRLGTSFEQEFARLLSNDGYWVKPIPDNKNGQPFDIITGKDNKIYAFECKTCNSSFFPLSRVEDNQRYAIKKFIDCGNHEAYFVFKYETEIFYCKALDILHCEEKRIKITELKRWDEFENNDK